MEITIESQYEVKLLEVLSIISKKDFTDGFKIITGNTKNKKGKVYLIKEDNHGPKIDVTIIYNNMMEILSIEDMPSTKLEKFIIDGRKSTYNKLNNSFRKEKDFYLTDKMKEETEKTNEELREIMKEKTKDKQEDTININLSIVDIDKTKKILKEKKIDSMVLNSLISTFPFMEVLKKKNLHKVKKVINTIDKRGNCNHHNLQLNKKEHGKIKGYRFIAIAKCPDCDMSLAITPGLTDTFLIDDLNYKNYLPYQDNLKNSLEFLTNPEIDFVIDFLDFTNFLDEKYKNIYKPIRENYMKLSRYNSMFENYSLFERNDNFIIREKENKLYFKFYGKTFSSEDWLNNKNSVQNEVEEIIKEEISKLEKEIKQYYLKLENILAREEMMGIFLAIKQHSGYGKGTYAKLLKGSKDKKLKKYKLNNSSHYGKLNKFKISEIETLIEELEDAELIFTRYIGIHNLPIIEISEKGEVAEKNVKAKKKDGKIKDNSNEIYSKLVPSKAFTTLNSQELEGYISGFNIARLEEETIFLELLNCFFEYRKNYLPFIDKMIELMSKIPDKYIPILELHYAMGEGVQKTTLKQVLQLAKGEQ